jgi:DNA polymerase-3 subunit alpha
MSKNKIDKKISTQIWNWIEPFAAYSFNKSHATAYATISYQTAYLKAYYPVEFMSALLISEKGNTERISVLIDECKKMNIKILPPDINESFREFSVVPKTDQIRFGLFAIKNVGDAVVNIIISERKDNGPFKSMEDFVTRVEGKALNKKSMESMIRSGVFDRFEERGTLLANLEDLLVWARNKQKIKESGQKGLFDSSTEEKSKLTLMPAEQIPTKQMLSWEKELLGLYVSSHPLDPYRESLTNRTLSISKITTADFNVADQRVRVGGIITFIKKIITKKGLPMLFLTLEDFTDKIEVVVFPTIYSQFESKLQEEKILLISGRIDYRDGSPKLICEDVEELLEK